MAWAKFILILPTQDKVGLVLLHMKGESLTDYVLYGRVASVGSDLVGEKIVPVVSEGGDFRIQSKLSMSGVGTIMHMLREFGIPVPDPTHIVNALSVVEADYRRQF